jgi:hypothetical protein
MQSATKKAILLRSARKPSFSVVPEHAIKLFDRVIEQTADEAVSAHPDDRWGQIEFWKEEILSRVLPKLRGIVSVYYHEYIASLLRGEEADLGDDPYGFEDRGYNPHAEAIARRDAYAACTASLA